MGFFLINIRYFTISIYIVGEQNHELDEQKILQCLFKFTGIPCQKTYYCKKASDNSKGISSEMEQYSSHVLIISCLSFGGMGFLPMKFIRISKHDFFFVLIIACMQEIKFNLIRSKIVCFQFILGLETNLVYKKC